MDIKDNEKSRNQPICLNKDVHLELGLMSIRDLKRFLSYVNQNAPEVPGIERNCWEWTGALDSKGRPRFYVNRRGAIAKRAIVEILTGKKISEDCEVALLCRNTSCVRPEHIVLCNHIDAYALSRRGRIGVGDYALMGKLNSDGYLPEELAVMYGVSVRLVEEIIREQNK